MSLMKQIQSLFNARLLVLGTDSVDQLFAHILIHTMKIQNARLG